jgi:V-type H+-transporting ATPase subunit H
LQKQKYGDDDITEELEAAESVLQANIDDLTSFSEYVGELQSGVLEWSPVHTSVRFWQENCKKFEDNQCAVLKELASLLATSTNELTLCVACHDVGELVRRHPSGRQILEYPGLQGCKERIMTLMSADSPEVAKHALTAVQKILVDRA